ncbi:MAG: TPM domain-containing protein [Isosphaeraceae bacterium]
MIRAGRFPVLLILAAGGLSAATTAIAQAPQAIGVRDRANLFSKGAISEAHDRLKKVYDQTKMQVAIETVDSLDGKTAQALATSNAKALKVHGLYVLLAKKEHKIAAEPSDQTRNVFTSARCEAIVKAFADGLRADKADEGLSNAVAAIIRDTGASVASPGRPNFPGLAASDPAGVYDHARVFTNEAAQEADRLLKELEKHEGKWEAVVETVPSLDGRDIKEVLAEHAKAKEIRGIYVLISRDDKKFRVDRSNSAASVFTQPRIDAITQVLGDSFKAGDFDEGLKSAVAEIRKSVDSKLIAAAPAARPTAKPAPAPPRPEVAKDAAPAPVPNPSDKPILPGPGESASKPARSEAKTAPSRPESAPTQEPKTTPANAGKPAGGIPRPLIFLLLAGAVVLGIFLVRKMFGGGSAPQQPSFVPANAPRANNPAPGFGPAVGGQPMGGNPGGMVGGQPGYGPGYGPPPPGGYPPGYAPPPPQGGGMGSFVKGALGGAAGAVVGNMIYDQFGRPHPAHASEIHPGQGHVPPQMPGQAGGVGEGYHSENAAVGGWDAPAAPADEWGGNAGAEGGWDNSGANQGGGDWGTPEEAGAQGDWGPPPAAPGQGDWGAGQDAGGGGDWGGQQDAGGGGGDWGPDQGGDGGGGGDWGGGQEDPNSGGW